MADILVVKVNMFMRSKNLQDIDKYIRDSIKTGVVVLPPYCEAQVVPENIEVRVEDMFTKKVENNNDKN